MRLAAGATARRDNCGGNVFAPAVLAEYYDHAACLLLVCSVVVAEVGD